MGSVPPSFGVNAGRPAKADKGGLEREPSFSLVLSWASARGSWKHLGAGEPRGPWASPVVPRRAPCRVHLFAAERLP